MSPSNLTWPVEAADLMLLAVDAEKRVKKKKIEKKGTKKKKEEEKTQEKEKKIDFFCIFFKRMAF